MWVALKRESGIHIEQFKEELRGKLAQALPDVQFSFEPADIINEVMSFGSPTPVEVAVSGPDFSRDPPLRGESSWPRWRRFPACGTSQIVQSLDYPTVQVDVDRKKAGTVYVTPIDVARSLAEATSSSRFTVPNFWADPKTGIGYQVQVEVPRPVVRSPKGIKPLGSIADLQMVPVKRNAAGQVLVRDVATVSTGNHARRNRPLQHATPGEHDGEHRRHRPRQRLAAGRRGPAAGGRAPARRQGRSPRADSAACATCSAGWPLGLGLAIVVIFLLLAANFQSLRLSLVDRLHGPGGHRRRGGDALPDPHDAEHPVLHRRDHGRGRGDGQRDSAGHVRRKPAPARRGRGRTRRSRARGAGCGRS